jgi:hypothetical protein
MTRGPVSPRPDPRLGETRPRGLPQPKQQEHNDDEPRDQRQQEQRPELIRPAPEKGGGQHGPERRTGVVHGAVESKRAAPQVRVRGIGDQRIARRSANPLADPVADADGEQLPRGDD